jgi:hypothetical protein
LSLALANSLCQSLCISLHSKYAKISKKPLSYRAAFFV